MIAFSWLIVSSSGTKNLALSRRGRCLSDLARSIINFEREGEGREGRGREGGREGEREGGREEEREGRNGGRVEVRERNKREEEGERGK